MDEGLRRDIQNVLDGAYGNIKSGRYDILHGLSDHVIHSLSIYQTEDILKVAVLVYSLNKILEEEKFEAVGVERFRAQVLKYLDNSRKSLRTRKDDVYEAELNKLWHYVRRFSTKIRLYVEDLLTAARVSKGGKLYEHGLSLGRAAETAGVTEWELMGRAGKTKISEQVKKSPALNKRRIALLEELFG